MMDSFNEDSSVVQQQTGIDPTIHEIKGERTNEEAVDLDHPRGPEDEVKWLKHSKCWELDIYESQSRNLRTT